LWVWAIFGLVALGIWLLIAGATRLYTRFEYTKRSLWGLYVCAAVSLGLGTYVGTSLLGLPPVFGVAVGFGISLALFIALASAMTEAWLSMKLARFDRTIEQLLDREYLEKTRLEDAREKVHGESLKRQGSAQRTRDMVERRSQLVSAVDAWQQGGGIARTRSLKVEEWRRTYHAMDDTSLARERDRLKSEIQAAASHPEAQEQARQLRTELAVLDLTVIDRHMPAGDESPDIEGLFREEERVKTSLDTIKVDIDEWRRKRSDFLGRKIRLD